MPKYIIAVKREERRNVSEDWYKPVLEIEGLKVLSPLTESRIVVEGDEGAITALKRVLSPWCHIEPWIEHRPTR